MKIGKPQRRVRVEPVKDPVPAPAPTPALVPGAPAKCP